MLIVELAFGIALGVALIPVARWMLWGVVALPGLLWRLVCHPLVIITSLLLLGALWSSPSCHPSPASFAHSSQRPLY